jgi:nitroreductase/Pyruvate/2-oxoacid:ferredoxin oxidoreductase delta subunit
MPTFNSENCTRCLKCVKDCPSKAINIDLFTIDSTCIHCGHCVAICPEMAVIPDQGHIIPLEQLSFSGDMFRSLSASIRTCRSYSKKEVSEELIGKLVENMKHYPSASNARPIQITIVKTPEKVQQLNDETLSVLVKTLKIITYPIIKGLIQLFVPKMNVKSLSKYRTKFIEQQKTNSSLICHHAPVVMLFHAPKSSLSMSGEDAYIWATYTSIYANTLGLGTCFNGFIVQSMKRSKKMRSSFSLPDNHQIHAALLIGYPKVSYKNETSRKEPEVKVI